MVLPVILMCLPGCQYRTSTSTYQDYWKNASCCPCLNDQNEGSSTTRIERRGSIHVPTTGAYTFKVTTSTPRTADVVHQVEFWLGGDLYWQTWGNYTTTEYHLVAGRRYRFWVREVSFTQGTSSLPKYLKLISTPEVQWETCYADAEVHLPATGNFTPSTVPPSPSSTGKFTPSQSPSSAPSQSPSPPPSASRTPCYCPDDDVGRLLGDSFCTVDQEADGIPVWALVPTILLTGLVTSLIWFIVGRVSKKKKRVEAQKEHWSD
jgi:hypothetical protein